MIRIAINGLGRIGRCIVRAIFEENYSNIELVAVNGPAPVNTQVHLLKYDSVHGRFNKKVTYKNNVIDIDNKKVILFNEKDPEKLPWKDLNIDIVLDCTGIFFTLEKAQKHINAGCKKVLLSGPAKSDDIKTVIYGINENILSVNDQVVSIGSCTTNCLAPIVKILDDNIGIKSGLMTTIHSYTNDQNVVDNSHKDLKRARACALSIIPTTTGAAKAIGLVLPNMVGKLDGYAIRVPTVNVSMVELNFTTSKDVSAQYVNNAIYNSITGKLKKIIDIIDEPLVSIDFNHSKHSAYFDTTQTKVIGNLVKVCAWYDNEWSFALRMLDMAEVIQEY